MRRKICRQAEALLLVGTMLIGNTIYFPDRISAQENETESVQAESLQPAEEEKTELTETTESTENRTVAENTLLPTQEELESWEEDGTLEARIEFMEEVQNAVYFNGTVSQTQTVYTFENNMPSTGDVKGLVFLVQFSDVKNTDESLTAENIKDSFFGEGNEWAYPYESLANYYERSSYGKLNIEGEVYGWYDLAHDKEYYKNAEYGREEIAAEVMEYYDDIIDYSQYDSDGDGFLDSIYFIYAGSTDNWGEFYWSYKTSAQQEVSYDDVYLNNYVFQTTESYLLTAIHETGHLLGLTDYYNQIQGITDKPSEDGGVGYFDMMDNNCGDQNIFSKLLLGWVDPVFVTEDSEITLSSIDNEEAKAVIVTPNDEHSVYSEYYLLELVNNEGNNAHIDSCEEGAVRIYHVNAEVEYYGDLESGYYDFKNDNTYSEFKLIKLLESDGTEENGLYGYPITSDKYYYEGMQFGVNTTPGSEFYEGVFTGINISIDKVEKETAHVTITFEETDSEKPALKSCKGSELMGYVTSVSGYYMYFDNYIYKGENFNAIECYPTESPESKVYIIPEILNARSESYYPDSDSRYHILRLSSDQELESDTEYAIHIPAGAVRDAYGNENEDIVQLIHTMKLADNAQVQDYDLLTPEGEYADTYTLSAYKMVDLESGCLAFASAGQKKFNGQSDYFSGNGLVSLKIFDADGVSLVNKSLLIEGAWKQNQMLRALKVLGNGNFCLILDRECVILDQSGELVSETIFDQFVFEMGAGVSVVERDDCLDVHNYNDEEHAIYRISLEDGGISIISNSISSNDIPYYDKDYQNREEKEQGDTPYTLFNRNNGRIGDIGFWLHSGLKIVENDRMIAIGQKYKSYSFIWTFISDFDSDIEVLDEDYYKLADINMRSVRENIAGIAIVSIKDGDGYIISDCTYEKNTGSDTYRPNGTYIMRMDKDYNIKWVTKITEASSDVTRALYYDGKITVILGDVIVTLDDYDTTYISSEKQFSYMEDECLSVDEETQRLTLDEKVSISDIKKHIQGSYGVVKFYDQNMYQVTDESMCIPGGLVSIESADGRYTWYYKVSQEEPEILEFDIGYYSEGVLTIEAKSGSRMPDYSEDTGNVIPWAGYEDEIVKVIVEEGVEYIGKDMFANHRNLKEVILPDSLVEIGEDAFKNTGIETLYIPKSLERISINFGDLPFLTDICVDEHNVNFVFENGMLFDTGKTHLIGCLTSKTGNVCIPDSVLTCEEKAFFGCSKITGLYIPAGMKVIPCLQGCSSLETIKISDDFSGIFTEGCFRDCDKLRILTIPENVPWIALETICDSHFNKVIFRGVNTKIMPEDFMYEANLGYIEYCAIYGYRESYESGCFESLENIPWIEIHSYYLDGENMDAEYFVPKTDNNCYVYYEGEELLIRGIGEEMSLKDVEETFENEKEYLCIRNQNGELVTDENEIIGTGYTISLVKNGMTLSEAEILIKGDVDGNGMINVLDMELIQKHILSIGSLDGIFKNAAELTSEEELSVLDMEKVQKHILGLDTILD